MLIRFVYLDRPTLAGFVSQLDGGLIAETTVRLVKKRSGGVHIDTRPAAAMPHARRRPETINHA
jgi:hypothetical protein